MGRVKISAVVPARRRSNRGRERARPRAHEFASGYDYYLGMFAKQSEINRSLETFV